ncbi:Heavy metal transport/detoxification protein [Pedosphaera parvula Ellin514]|uniref:Heavy metal transport/detoxification protein n=2 Tax=Pedosphaera TaxID=1032526 RepID=B9XQK8_PEDPL|nr:Heavy metal transport/detoxification protein [Pedosphaera parvula Ellin514]
MLGTEDDMDKKNIANLSPEERLLETHVIEIDGMTCDSCVNIINDALQAVDGVKEVRVDRPNRRVHVTYDSSKTNIPALHDVLLDHGYRPTIFAEPAR